VQIRAVGQGGRQEFLTCSALLSWTRQGGIIEHVLATDARSRKLMSNLPSSLVVEPDGEVRVGVADDLVIGGVRPSPVRRPTAGAPAVAAVQANTWNPVVGSTPTKTGP